jgi:hypothetical protein
MRQNTVNISFQRGHKQTNPVVDIFVVRSLNKDIKIISVDSFLSLIIVIIICYSKKSYRNSNELNTKQVKSSHPVVVRIQIITKLPQLRCQVFRVTSFFEA